MILASEEGVKKHGLTPRARVLGMATAGVAPRIMGIGPVPAMQKLMARLDLKIDDFDVIELNEAFAVPGPRRHAQLGLPDDAEHVNPNGGAIALGHPLGVSGARMADRRASAREDRRQARAGHACASASAKASRWRSSGCRTALRSLLAFIIVAAVHNEAEAAFDHVAIARAFFGETREISVPLCSCGSDEIEHLFCLVTPSPQRIYFIRWCWIVRQPPRTALPAPRLVDCHAIRWRPQQRATLPACRNRSNPNRSTIVGATSISVPNASFRYGPLPSPCAASSLVDPDSVRGCPPVIEEAGVPDVPFFAQRFTMIAGDHHDAVAQVPLAPKRLEDLRRIGVPLHDAIVVAVRECLNLPRAPRSPFLARPCARARPRTTSPGSDTMQLLLAVKFRQEGCCVAMVAIRSGVIRAQGVHHHQHDILALEGRGLWIGRMVRAILNRRRQACVVELVQLRGREELEKPAERLALERTRVEYRKRDANSRGQDKQRAEPTSDPRAPAGPFAKPLVGMRGQRPGGCADDQEGCQQVRRGGCEQHRQQRVLLERGRRQKVEHCAEVGAEREHELIVQRIAPHDVRDARAGENERDHRGHQSSRDPEKPRRQRPPGSRADNTDADDREPEQGHGQQNDRVPEYNDRRIEAELALIVQQIEAGQNQRRGRNGA